jgi:site-specific recombinase XerD
MNPDSLKQLVEPWIADRQANDQANNTLRLYKTAVLAFLDWYQGEEQRSIGLADLTPIALIGYRNEIQHNQNKAVSTVNAHVAALRSWCAWLYKKGHLASNPGNRLKFIGNQAINSARGLKDKESNALLREAQRTRYPERAYAILQMLLQTGIRVGECAALNYQDIHLSERSGSLSIRSGKGNKARLVPLNGSARKALIEYVGLMLNTAATLEAVLSAWPSRQLAQPTPLWISQKAGRLSTSAIQRVIDNLVQVCSGHGLIPSDTSAHTLRHTFARAYLQENPGDVLGLATLLGHQSLDTTRLYSQPTVDQLAERIEHLRLNAYKD